MATVPLRPHHSAASRGKLGGSPGPTQTQPGGRRNMKTVFLALLLGMAFTLLVLYAISPIDTQLRVYTEGTRRLFGTSVTDSSTPLRAETVPPPLQEGAGPGRDATQARVEGPSPTSPLMRHLVSRRPTTAPVRRATTTPAAPAAGSAMKNEPFQLMDIRNFRYTINNDVCGKEDVFYIAFVHSAPGNVAQRNAIRQAWGDTHSLDHRDLQLKIVFLLAQTSDHHQKNLVAENEKYGDIVQGTFVDAYRNLTYKHVMGLHWVSTYCPHAKFVLKTDDDIFVDTFHLTDLLWKNFRNEENLVWCNEWIGMPVLREKNSKWYVSREEYNRSSYTPYCSGWGLVLTPAAAAKVFAASASFKYFWVDDFLVTGPMVDAAGLKRTPGNEHFKFGVTEMEAWLADTSGGPKQSPCIVGPTWSNSDLMRRAWQRTLEYEGSEGSKTWAKISQPSS